MKIGIMQPYFWPYLGYFQLINAVDVFVVYDNIEYTKKGWINRNRYLSYGEDKFFTIPISKSSDFLDVREKCVSSDFNKMRLKQQIKAAYQKAPYFNEIYPIFCECIDFEENNLFEYIYHSLSVISNLIGIKTNMIISSSLGIGRELKGQEKVITICKKLQGDKYINPIGGQELYDKQSFLGENIELYFIKMNDDIVYKQFDNEFISSLSILDVLMFNSVEEVKSMLERYTIK